MGTWLRAPGFRVNSGPHRCAYGELLRHTDEARMAYARIAISPTRSAVLVVRADTITPARTPMRASKIRQALVALVSSLPAWRLVTAVHRQPVFVLGVVADRGLAIPVATASSARVVASAAREALPGGGEQRVTTVRGANRSQLH
jgi:hypothetical protein